MRAYRGIAVNNLVPKPDASDAERRQTALAVRDSLNIIDQHLRQVDYAFKRISEGVQPSSRTVVITPNLTDYLYLFGRTGGQTLATSDTSSMIFTITGKLHTTLDQYAQFDASAHLILNDINNTTPTVLQLNTNSTGSYSVLNITQGATPSSAISVFRVGQLGTITNASIQIAGSESFAAGDVQITQQLGANPAMLITAQAAISTDLVQIKHNGNLHCGIDTNLHIFTRTLQLRGSTSGTARIACPATTANYTVTWPNAQGAATTVLLNDGSGNLSWASLSSFGGAANTEAFVTIGNTSGLTAERALTGTSNQIVVTDNGAGSTVVLSTPQNLHTSAAFQVATLGIGAAVTAGIELDVTGDTRTTGRLAMTPLAVTLSSNPSAWTAPTTAWIRVSSNAASRTITGIDATGAIDGQLIGLIDVGANGFSLVNESGSATATNRIHTNTGANITTIQDKLVWMMRDATTGRWRAWEHLTPNAETIVGIWTFNNDLIVDCDQGANLILSGDPTGAGCFIDFFDSNTTYTTRLYIALQSGPDGGTVAIPDMVGTDDVLVMRDLAATLTSKTMAVSCTGPGTGPLSSTRFAQTADSTVANTVTETTLVGTGSGSATLAANYFAAGRSIRITASGVYSTTGTPTLRFRVKKGSTVLADTGAVTTASGVTGRVWSLSLIVTARSTTTVIANGFVSVFTAAQTHSAWEMNNGTTTVTIGTGSEAFSLTAEWGTASASNTITCTNLVLEPLFAA